MLSIIILTIIILTILIFLLAFLLKRTKKSDCNLLEHAEIIDEDYKNFDSFFPEIRRSALELNEHCPQVRERLDKALMYNIVGGKKFRGVLVVKCLKNLVPTDAFTAKLISMSYATGWALEILHAACLIDDDIMDKSVTRRGKLCWYLHENNDVLAINDAYLLKISAAQLCNKYCNNHPCHLKMIDLSMVISKLTMFGQILDCITTPDCKRPNFSLFNAARYETIVKYKTSYYTFVLPVRRAMYLANITDANMHLDVENVLLRIGHLYQAEDDYLDIYGNPEVTGKVGTDIEDGKCSWIAVHAYRMMDQPMKKVFEESYGRKHRVAAIKKMFEKLQMKTVFKAFEAKEFKEIEHMIARLEQKYQLRLDAIQKLLILIYKRVK